MGLVLDTSILIAAERKEFDLVGFLVGEAPADSVFITAVTATELLRGVHRAEGARRIAREVFVEEILSRLPVLPFDLLSARSHSRIWADLEAKGMRIGAHDLVIAAICLTLDHSLATLNRSEFSRIDGLRLAESEPYRISR
jgi:tRNA(fMet)-specific endonuclease VapC